MDARKKQKGLPAGMEAAVTSWVRLWHDMPTDPKWRAIAKNSGQDVSAVVVTFILMMTNASANSQQRGTLDNWTDEDAAAAFDLEADAVKAIREAMQGKVLDGNRLSGWEKRQPQREDDSTLRVRAHRKREASARQRNETRRNAPDTESETDAESDYDSATKEESMYAGDWKMPAVEQLPTDIRERVSQWPDGEYDREVACFSFDQPSVRRTAAQWWATWNDHIMTVHDAVMEAASAIDRKPADESSPLGSDWQANETSAAPFGRN